MTNQAIEDSIINQAIALKKNRLGFNQSPYTIFGLSANPPTLGHLDFIKHLIQMGRMVIIMPNNQSTLKQTGIPGAVKQQMLQSMLDEYGILPNTYHLSDLEINRPAPSRMITTLALLQQPVTLALGLDTLQSLTRWSRWQDLSYFCDLVFYPRPLACNDNQSIEDAIKTMSVSLAQLTQTGMAITFVYHTQAQQNLYEAIIENTCSSNSNALIRLRYEHINLIESSSTAVRNHYETSNEHHPFVSSGVHQIIVNHGFFKHESPLLDTRRP